jgi:hypothetical protein
MKKIWVSNHHPSRLVHWWVLVQSGPIWSIFQYPRMHALFKVMKWSLELNKKWTLEIERTHAFPFSDARNWSLKSNLKETVLPNWHHKHTNRLNTTRWQLRSLLLQRFHEIMWHFSLFCLFCSWSWSS